MKAKDYVKKYRQPLVDNYNDSSKLGEVISGIYHEYIEELKDICKVRHCMRNRAVMGVVNEQNAKWNAMASLFESEGITSIRYDGFKSYTISLLKSGHGVIGNDS